ncbi:NADP-dependent oxidoreductase [Archangium violaceum]|uniref:NADP-dependent oxidoreductase n=1 Tax=Archangium violaceum TaxID=83451 RepID=UPI002B2C0CFB|nr:NADP-dependent oxidoreductase [Archangium gephyra]
MKEPHHGPTMRAFFIRRYGGPEVLEQGELPSPPMGPRDVRIAVHAASINPVDWKVRQGTARILLPYRFPLVLGNDCAGEVLEVGPEVKAFKPGDAVWTRLDKDRPGAFAEEVVAPENVVALKPSRLSYEEAASLPLVGLTAWQALVDVAKLSPGQKVLVHAGAGGVGSVAVQLARHLGARVVATASAKNMELVKGFGADEVVDYRTQRFEDVVRDADMVFDTVGADTQLRSFKSARKGGIVVSITDRPDMALARSWGLSPVLWPVFALVGARATFAAWRHGVRYTYLFMNPNGEQLRQLGELVEAGKLRPHVDRVFPFDQTREAIAHAESGQARGKVVIRVRG